VAGEDLVKDFLGFKYLFPNKICTASLKKKCLQSSRTSNVDINVGVGVGLIVVLVLDVNVLVRQENLALLDGKVADEVREALLLNGPEPGFELLNLLESCAYRQRQMGTAAPPSPQFRLLEEGLLLLLLLSEPDHNRIEAHVESLLFELSVAHASFVVHGVAAKTHVGDHVHGEARALLEKKQKGRPKKA